MTHPGQFIFSPDSFNAIFPFYLLVDKKGQIVSLGKSLGKAIAVSPGENFFDIFSVRRPSIDHEHADQLFQMSNQMVILKARSKAFILRGQFEHYQEEFLLFVGAPWVDRVDDLFHGNLVMSDFAIHDPMVDLLHLLRRQELSTQEIRVLLEQINSQKNRLANDKSELKRRENMLHALAQATDQLISNPNFIDAVRASLDVVGKSAGLSHSFLVEVSAETGVLLLHHFDVNEDVCQVAMERLASHRFTDLGSAADALLARETTILSSDQLRSNPVVNLFRNSSSVASVLLVPVFDDETLWGFAGFNDTSAERRWAEADLSLFKSFSNSVSHALERSKSQIQLMESEKRMATMVSNLQAGLLLEDESRHIVLCNAAFCDMFHIPVLPEHMIGMDCSNAAEQSKMMFKNPDQFVARIQDVLAARKLVKADVLELADGRVFERDYIPIYIAEEYRGHLWNYTDVTNRRNYEEKLRRQEEKYRGIIENMNLGLIEVNLDDEILYVNQSFTELSGFNTNELIGQKAAELFLDSSQRDVIYEKNNLRKQNISDTYEIKVKNKSGEERWWFISGAPNFNIHGEQIGSIGIHLDISEQKNLEAELRISSQRAEESSKAKENFLMNMSHEIRTPLNAIIGMVRELGKTNLSKPQKVYVQHARSASQHLLSIVNNILDISKIDAGEFMLDTQTFSLAQVLLESEAIVLPMAKEKGLRFDVDFDNTIAPALLGDAGRLRQIVLNLVGNSIKFTDTGGIDIRCRNEGIREGRQYVSLSISDTGVGMEKEFLHKLFNKFSQEDSSVARKRGGTGLGMAITQELISLMGGSIEVFSQKGSGTSFMIDLSFPVGNPLEIQDKPSQNQYNLLYGRKVLLVEDNELNRLVAMQALSRHKVEVTEVESGVEAVNILKEQTFDIVLMDLQMPFMGGIEATRIIRNELLIQTPIIAFTANVVKNEMERCVREGMNAVVQKPFEEEMLLDTIVRLLPKDTTQRKPNFDLSSLVDTSRGDEAFVNKMLQIFCGQVPGTIEALRKGLAEKDWETVRRVAHKVKPGLITLNIPIVDEIRALESINEFTKNEVRIGTDVARVCEVLGEVHADLQKRMTS